MGSAQSGQDGSRELRIFCVCGQKMRVMPEMFGKPGKCVSCRQKIRIPDVDEVPASVRVIDLTEHPEFLRADRKEAGRVPAEKKSPRSESLIEPAEDDGEQRMALDVLEPLKALVSVEYRLKHKLDVLRSNPPEDSPFSEDDLRETLQRVREQRGALNDELESLRSRTEETLAEVRQDLTSLESRARSGTMTFREYQGQARASRRQRDALARREWNLTGWLSARTPFDAGGYVRLPLDHVPELPKPAVPPEPPEPTGNLTVWWVERLRLAFEQRAEADREYHEAGAAEKSANASPDDALRRADAQSERARWDANIACCRERLRRRKDDLRTDSGVVQDMMDLLRNRFDVSEIDRATYEREERELEAAQTALREEINQVNRSLLANAPRELPDLRAAGAAVFVTPPRPAPQPRAQSRWGLDAALAGIAAALFLLSLFLPVVDRHSAVSALVAFFSGTPLVLLLVVTPLLAALTSAVAAALPFPAFRGVVSLAVSCLVFLASIVYFQQMSYAHGAFGQALRAQDSWVMRPGVLVFYIAVVSLLFAAGMALSRHRSLWPVVPIAACATAVLAAVALFAQGPAMAMPVVAEPELMGWTEQGRREIRLVVSNPTRSAATISIQESAAGAVDLFVEKRSGSASWEPTAGAHHVEQRPPGSENPAPAQTLKLQPGMSAALVFELGPGAYRVVLGGRELHSFDVGAAPPPSADPPPPRPEDAPEPVTGAEPADSPSPTEEPGTAVREVAPPGPRPEAAPPRNEASPGEEFQPSLRPGSVRAVLKGMLVVREDDPRFTFVLEYPDGRSEELTAGLNELVVGRWRVAEYNPVQQTVTLTANDQMLILRRQREYVLQLQ